jgi:hypothetical protein
VFEDVPAGNNGGNNPDHALDGLRYYFAGSKEEREITFGTVYGRRAPGTAGLTIIT